MKKRFLLRVDPGVCAALEKWAPTTCARSVRQADILLQQALKRAGSPEDPPRQ